MVYQILFESTSCNNLLCNANNGALRSTLLLILHRYTLYHTRGHLIALWLLGRAIGLQKLTVHTITQAQHRLLSAHTGLHCTATASRDRGSQLHLLSLSSFVSPMDDIPTAASMLLRRVNDLAVTNHVYQAAEVGAVIHLLYPINLTFKLVQFVLFLLHFLV